MMDPTESVQALAAGLKEHLDAAIASAKKCMLASCFSVRHSRVQCCQTKEGSLARRKHPNLDFQIFVQIFLGCRVNATRNPTTLVPWFCYKPQFPGHGLQQQTRTCAGANRRIVASPRRADAAAIRKVPTVDPTSPARPYIPKPEEFW